MALRRTVCRMEVGISAMAVHLPPFRVQLEDWCKWTGNSWGKVRSVVGDSFRIPGPHENVYTMAGNAVLRLLLDHDVDPREICFLGFGTESSTDNSAGAVIIKGMVDEALEQLGRPRISRHIEVPEFKHACLGGVYALKNACRVAELDPRGRKAIVVAADIAEYERGSTGEQTQGAGAVAMLVEANPKILAVHHTQAGSSASYRGPDFRKPVSRHFHKEWAKGTRRHADFPVFSGPYSTTVYTDTTIHAVEDMIKNLKGQGGGRYYDSVAGLFLHRPYRMMPVQAMSFMYVRGLARGGEPAQEKLQLLCKEAGVELTDLLQEVSAVDEVHAFSLLKANSTPPTMHRLTGLVAKVLRKDPEFLTLLQNKMSFGQGYTAHFGNLYSAALPAWLAAGMQDAAERNVPLAGRAVVGIGYGSGDAAEAIPMTVVPGWEAAALKSGVREALCKPTVDLTQEQYEAIHDTRDEEAFPSYTPIDEFVIDHVGERVEASFQDLGIEYYKYAACA